LASPVTFSGSKGVAGAALAVTCGVATGVVLVEALGPDAASRGASDGPWQAATPQIAQTIAAPKRAKHRARM
jgi:hypothetical protein